MNYYLLCYFVGFVNCIIVGFLFRLCDKLVKKYKDKHKNKNNDDLDK